MTLADECRVVLNVGCGPREASAFLPINYFRAGEWRELRLDIDAAVEPDFVASITDMAPVESASVDAVFSSHNLEHLHSFEVPKALSEFRRVIRPGGFALVTMPDLQQAAAMIAAGKLVDLAYMSPAGPIAPIDMLFGYRPFTAASPYMAHRTGFIDRTLGSALHAAGFGYVHVWRDGRFGLWGVGKVGAS